MKRRKRYHTLYPSLRVVDPFNMTHDDLHIEDVAHALARICRFGGSCAGFISVGGHSLDVLYATKNQHPNESAQFYLTALLHDGPEYVLGDVITGLKRQDAFKQYKKKESNLAILFASKFGLIYPTPEPIKRIDVLIGDREAETDRYDSTRLDSYELTKARFLKEFYALTEGTS